MFFVLHWLEASLEAYPSLSNSSLCLSVPSTWPKLLNSASLFPGWWTPSITTPYSVVTLKTICHAPSQKTVPFALSLLHTKVLVLSTSFITKGVKWVIQLLKVGLCSLNMCIMWELLETPHQAYQT